MPNDSPLTDTLRQTHATALVDLLLNQLLERELGRLRQTHATLDIEGDSSATLRPAPHEQETVDRQLPHGPHLPASTQGPNSHSSHYVEEYRYDSDNNVGEDSIPRPASVLAAGSVVSSSPLSQQAVPGSDDSNLRVLVQNLQQEVQGLRSVQVLVPNLQQEVQELRSLIQDSDFERAHGYQSSLYEDDDTDSGVVFLYIYGSQE
ncbi:hypothetical protein D9758_011501 [Tetrapyrgos nigripes]|uniref:Uncharacterized protein n=1 Tax=Tetrapyrgos nigripes TaxID=182062 RepID=A0A8H5FRD1_9AGAR|nr:hypothetical protein D9758_011501 [Tetrapyrgos nigripes]